MRHLQKAAAVVCTLLATISCCGCGARFIPSSNEVVFIGASITARWASYANFESYGWIDKGISGQTSVQVAARFQTDVIALRPAAVHILVGSNDLTSTWDPQTTWNAYDSMIRAARSAGISVYMGTIPPWGDGPAARRIDPDYAARNQRVQMVNAWIKSQRNVRAIDYYSILVGNNSLYKPALTDDGIHPNGAGYALMTPLALQSLTSVRSASAAEGRLNAGQWIGDGATVLACPFFTGDFLGSERSWPWAEGSGSIGNR